LIAGLKKENVFFFGREAGVIGYSVLLVKNRISGTLKIIKIEDR
jgi:hypothetical protein